MAPFNVEPSNRSHPQQHPHFVKAVTAPKRRLFATTDAATRKRMRNVPSTNTRLEQLVQQALQAGGVPYSIDHHGLPGKPDIILHHHHAVIFVHGCFWHGHSRCLKGRTLPARNRTFWTAKQTYNHANHRRVAAALRRMGWKVWVAWECQIMDPRRLARLLASRLPGSRTLTNPC